MPKSYLSDEPAAQRAKLLGFDPRLQVEGRIKQLESNGHITEKVDLIVIGGTFGAYPDEYKLEFFKGMYDGVNGFVAKTLEEAIRFNETGKRRVVGISVETRPDWVSEDEIKFEPSFTDFETVFLSTYDLIVAKCTNLPRIETKLFSDRTTVCLCFSLFCSFKSNIL